MRKKKGRRTRSLRGHYPISHISSNTVKSFFFVSSTVSSNTVRTETESYRTPELFIGRLSFLISRSFVVVVVVLVPTVSFHWSDESSKPLSSFLQDSFSRLYCRLS